MTILGLDLATNSGYSVLKDGQLVKYGMINIPSEMNIFQRLKFFESNLKQILNDTDPDEVHIEDLILGISGVKTLSYLARLNGIAISVCYDKVGDNIKLYQPPIWKAHSFPGLHGMSKKAEIQIAVIKHFKLINDNDLDIITKPLNEFTSEDNKLQKILDEYKCELAETNKILNRKKSSEQDKATANISKRDLESKIKDIKKKLDIRKRDIEKVYKSVSIALTAKCGLTADVSDSIGIAYCNI